MSAINPSRLPIDERIWREELCEFVPTRIFDAHTHIYQWDFNLDPGKEKSGMGKLLGHQFANASREALDCWDACLFPDRTVARLAFPFPFPQCDFDASNRYIADQIAGDSESAALMLVHPSMSAEQVDQTVETGKFVGFKPYRLYSKTGDVDECRIADFMPEHLLEIADRRGLLIMMHLSRRDAIADEWNLKDLVSLCERFPNVRWILAHCARSYSCWALDKAAPVLRKLPNVWFDTSSVCETDSMYALYEAVGPDRVLYGSDDIPVGVLRGKYVTFGYAWAYMSPDNQNLNLSHCQPDMTFTRYEQLRAMRRAARMLGFDSETNQRIFHDNAATLVRSLKQS